MKHGVVDPEARRTSTPNTAYLKTPRQWGNKTRDLRDEWDHRDKRDARDASQQPKEPSLPPPHRGAT